MGRVRLFIKPYCPWCNQAMDWLDRRRIDYDVLDVISDPTAFKEMIDISGQTYAPVIEVNGKVLADFDTKQLEQFWKENNFS